MDLIHLAYDTDEWQVHVCVFRHHEQNRPF
jgi:hypothetical protein